jgi:hypothetical protein
LQRDLANNGKSLDNFEIQFPVFVASGENAEELEKSKAEVKYRLGFYASTPAYRTVLETHGWGELQPRLNRLTKDGKWDQLPAMIDDEVLDAFAVVGEPLQVAQKLKDRFGAVVDRVALEAKFSSAVLHEQMRIIKG